MCVASTSVAGYSRVFKRVAGWRINRVKTCTEERQGGREVNRGTRMQRIKGELSLY